MAKPNIDENKLKALESAMAQIERNYGKGAVMKLGDNAHLNVETVPSGSLSLDIALGVGGVPKGRELRYMDLSQVVRLRLHFIWSQKYKKEAV